MKRRTFLKTSFLMTAVSLGFVPSFSQNLKKGKTMKIAVLAASGKSGIAITNEALSRGYSVYAFVRNAKKMEQKANLTVIQKDIFALTSTDLEGFDVIIDAFGEWVDLSLHKKHGEHLIKILQNNKARFLVVGGAGSLFMDKTHTTRLMDTKDFPDSYKGVAEATAEVLSLLRAEKSLNWVYVSPPAEFVADGAKTGKYKIIGEEFELNSKGQSRASYKDYASAMLDIAENKELNRVRVSMIEL